MPPPPPPPVAPRLHPLRPNLPRLPAPYRPIPGGPKKTEQSIQSIFQDFALINSYLFSPCWIDHQIWLRTLYFMSNFLWTVIFGICPISRVPRHDSFSSTCANTYQHSTSYKEISVPMTCLDCKSLLGNVVCKSMGNTRITEHNTRASELWKSGKSRK